MRAIFLAGLIAVAIGSNPTYAQEAPNANTVRIGVAPEASLGIAALAGTAIPNSELSRYSAEGGASLAVAEGNVAGNSVSGPSITGSNNISAQSVSNSSGIITVFQNTGNNSLLQNSTSIYVTIH